MGRPNHMARRMHAGAMASASESGESSDAPINSEVAFWSNVAHAAALVGVREIDLSSELLRRGRRGVPVTLGWIHSTARDVARVLEATAPAPPAPARGTGGSRALERDAATDPPIRLDPRAVRRGTLAALDAL